MPATASSTASRTLIGNSNRRYPLA
jgi:hypothetical protein